MRKYSNLNVAAILFILISVISIDVTWKHYVESSARTVARYSTENIKNCVNEIVLGQGQKEYRVVDNGEIEGALKTCAQKSLTTPTGDVFAFDLKTLNFVYDPSLDCYVPGGKKMTVESECSLHLDKEQCKVVMTDLVRGYDSDLHTHAWWRFNRSKEYLEWAVMPSETIGFDGIVRGGNIQPHQLVVVQGTIENELYARYVGFRIFIHVIGFVALIVTLLYSAHVDSMVNRNS